MTSFNSPYKPLALSMSTLLLGYSLDLCVLLWHFEHLISLMCLEVFFFFFFIFFFLSFIFHLHLILFHLIRCERMKYKLSILFYLIGMIIVHGFLVKAKAFPTKYDKLP